MGNMCATRGAEPGPRKEPRGDTHAGLWAPLSPSDSCPSHLLPPGGACQGQCHLASRSAERQRVPTQNTFQKKKKVKAMITGYPEKVVRDRAYDVNVPLCTAFKEEKNQTSLFKCRASSARQGCGAPSPCRGRVKRGWVAPGKLGTHGWRFGKLYEKQNLPHDCHHPSPAFQDMPLPIAVTRICTCLYESLRSAEKAARVTLG